MSESLDDKLPAWKKEWMLGFPTFSAYVANEWQCPDCREGLIRACSEFGDLAAWYDKWQLRGSPEVSWGEWNSTWKEQLQEAGVKE